MKGKLSKEIIIGGTIAIMWAIVSFFFIDKRYFTFGAGISYFNYVCCKFLAMALLVLAVIAIVGIIKSDDKKHIVQAVLWTVPVLAIQLLMVWFYLNVSPRWFSVTSGDMGLIFDCAKELKCYYDFHFLTGWVYIIALMFVPYPNAIIIFKILVWTVAAFYASHSVLLLLDKKDCKAKFRVIICVSVFLIMTFLPVMFMVTNCHRIYCYLPFLLLVYWRLYNIYQSDSKLSVVNMVIMAFAVACVTQWRPEGIVVTVVVAIILWLKYKKEHMQYRVLIPILLFIANLIVFIPQNIETFGGRNNYSSVRLHPAISYHITTMLYEDGIDRDKYNEELAAIDKVISIAAIDRLNNDLGQDTYANSYIRWRDGYVGVTPNYAMEKYWNYVRGEFNSDEENGFLTEEYMEYADAAKRIFISEPVVYIKTCIKSFLYVEDNGYLEGGSDSDIPVALLRVYYSLVIAAIINLLVMILAIARKKFFNICMSAGLFVQAGIVFILSPCAYYKYYLPVCLCVYVGTIMIAIDCYCVKKRK